MLAAPLPIPYYLVDLIENGPMAIALKKAGSFGAAWRVIAAVVMLAFASQCYLAQTHIHESTAAAAGALVHAPGPGKSPVGNSPLDCPFCQVVNHAGSVLLSDVPLLLLPSLWTRVVAPHLLVPDLATATNHPWQSRAPPLS